MTIKELEKELNITRANIRYYEKEGLLDPKRNDNEYRNYSKEDIQKLKKIILFRKCNISISNIRLIFEGKKNIDEVFKEQIGIIENEVKQLEGAKAICKKLALEKTNDIDCEKYINIMNKEEEKGHKFYSITEDYLYATEKIYQSIIENKEYKGDEKMEKRTRILVYTVSFIGTLLLLCLFNYILEGKIDLADNICFASILTIIDLLGAKKYIENKNNLKFNKKDNINHFIITILIMVISLSIYYTGKSLYESYKEPNENIIELSVKKSLIDIANKDYDKGIYAENHKIINYEIKDNKLYVNVYANYGVLDKKCNFVSENKNKITLIYKKNKNNEGIYELEKYIENDITENIDFNDKYYKNQINTYCKIDG